MEEPSRNRSSESSNFINQFVNVVYGILLGYGFSDSIREIKNGDLEGVGPIFSSLSVLFIIIVICVYWWDWYKNIGQRVETNAREFALDIAILVSLESLFFVYERPITFSFVFFVLSVVPIPCPVKVRSSVLQGTPSLAIFAPTHSSASSALQSRVQSSIPIGAYLQEEGRAVVPNPFR